jgi:hypothetical protein
MTPKHIEAAANLLAALAPADASVGYFFALVRDLGEDPTPDQVDYCVRATVATWGWPQ